MMKRLTALAIAICLMCAMAGSAFGAGGDQTDPAVTLSYLTGVWKPLVLQETAAAASSEFGKTYAAGVDALAQKTAKNNLSLQKSAGNRSLCGRLTLKSGDALTMLAGCKLTVLSGTLNADSPNLICVTQGTAQGAGSTLAANLLYMKNDAAFGGAKVVSATAEVLLDGVFRLTPSDATDYGSMAAALEAMGLFRGMTNGYNLEAAATRAQGLVMFLRLLGLEDEAAACTASVPFTDLPKNHWAYRYVAYAYGKGLTAGTSQTAFSPDGAITAQQYLTMLLRALHFAEGTDFTYETAKTAAATLGLFTAREIAAISAGSFARRGLVYLSYYALYCADHKSGDLLLDTLVAEKTLTAVQAAAGIRTVVGGRIV